MRVDEVDDALLKRIGRAVLRRARGIPGPDGYLLAPAPQVGDEAVQFECPACPGLHPKAGGSGHEEDCPVAEAFEDGSRRGPC